MSRCSRRPGRRTEEGFTLIEAIVAMSIISVAIVALVGSFAAAERSAAAAVTQTQAEVMMRTAGDGLQALAYVPCATTSSYSVSSGVQVSDVDTVPGGTASTGAVAAYYDCTTKAALNAACPAGDTCDYGLQRILLTVGYTNGSLTRTVYKGRY